MKAEAVAQALPQFMAECRADTVVVTGNSGISVAHAALMLIDFPLVLVRKPNDCSNGHQIEGPTSHILQRYVILDDLICSGDTVRRVQQTLLEYDEDTELAGVFLYCHGEEPTHWSGNLQCLVRGVYAH
jgi:adenine/guanine phosphoribosyltransferase-like PRPP-binding protein